MGVPFKAKNGLDANSNKIVNVANPTASQDAATKLYVDNAVGTGLPSQTGNSGKFLTTDATTASWSLVPVAGISATGTPSATTYLRGDGTWATVTSSGGDVVGPASSTDNAITRFDGTTGKLIQNSTATLSDGGIMVVTELNTDSIKSATANANLTIAPDGTGHLELNTDSIRIGDNNVNATISTHGQGDLILTTHKGSAVEGIIHLYDGANGNITLTPNGTGQVQVGTDQVVTLAASQTLTNKSISGSTNTLSNIANASTTATSANTASAIVARDGSGNFSAGTITANLTGNASGSSGSVPASGITGTTLASGVTASSLTSVGTLGSLTVSGNATFDTNTLFVDATNDRVGIGTASPSQKLDVNGGIKISGSASLGASVGTGGAVLDYQYPTTRLFIGDGTGWDFRISSRASSTTTDRVTFLDNGSVGIGASPSNKLHIAAAGLDISGGIAIDGSTMQGIRLQNTSNNNSSLGIWFGTNNVHWCGISGQRTDAANTWGTDLRFYTHEDAFSNITYARERMRITSGGDVGIGTTAGYGGRINVVPATTPTTFATGNQIQIGEATSNTGYRLQLGYINDATAGYIGSIQAYAGGSAGNMTLQGVGGNVGIGTASPYNLLEATKSGGATISIANSASGAGIMYGKLSFYSTDAAGAYSEYGGQIRSYSGIGIDYGDLRFYTGNGATTAERVRIDSSGNVGIGVTPSAWGSFAITQYKGGFIGSQNSSYLYVGQNTYFNGTDFKYVSTAAVTMLEQSFGAFTWYNAPSGTAGNTVTFTSRMALDTSGNLTNTGVFKGNSGSKGFGGITTTTSTSTPTGGSSGDHYYIY